MVENFTIEYTGNSTEDLEIDVAMVLGDYGWVGTLMKAAVYAQREYKHVRGVIYKNWENDDGWIGRVRSVSMIDKRFEKIYQ